MPTGKWNNLVYRLALPLAGVPVRGRLAHRTAGRSLLHLPDYSRILERHHVCGASLLLKDGENSAQVYTSLSGAAPKEAGEKTLFRVASITKTVTAAALLRLCGRGALSLDGTLETALPGAAGTRLAGITLRQLMSHTSGLRDGPAVDQALARGQSWKEILGTPGMFGGEPGAGFCYCNFGFGLLGCVLEAATGLPVSTAVRQLVLDPLGMRGGLDASALDPEEILPITRVLSRRRQPNVRVTPLGSIPLREPDPARHFGHTAGALYTDAASLSVLLGMIASGGMHAGASFLPETMVREMTGVHAEYGRLSPTLSYGLGLLIIRDPALSPGRILGHQGFAYGCADGAFWEEDTGRQMIFLNGGCSEARTGRLGLCNRDLLRYAFRREMPAWR